MGAPLSNAEILESTKDDPLVPLMAQGPRLVEELTGNRVSRYALLRWAVHGTSTGVRLRAPVVGNGRRVNRALLLEFFMASGEAKSKKPAESSERMRRKKMRRQKKSARSSVKS